MKAETIAALLKQRRFRAACNNCEKKYDFRVRNDQEGYTPEHIKYFKTKFVCPECMKGE